MKHLFTALLLGGTLFLSACSDRPETQTPAQAKPPTVLAVNNPLAYFAGRLLEGSSIEVGLPVPTGIDPANWQPALEDVLELQQAELILLNGAAYSKWLDKVNLDPHALVRSGETFRDQWIPLSSSVTHSHGPGGEHAHAGYAFTTWLDYSMAAEQASTVAAALANRWPEYGAGIETQLTTLLEQLGQLDSAYLQLAQSLSGRSLIYSHPVYQYFERRYGLAGKSLHWEPDSPAPEAEWQQLAQQIKPDSLMIWEDQPVPAIVERMKELGLEWAVLDPAANQGDSDWLSIQHKNLSNLKTITQ